MRAPPESLMPMTGQPILAARSITLHIFSLMTSPSEPPKTVKSWLKTHTRRPSIVPWPVTTASPKGRDLSMSNAWVRWRTYVSSSWNEPGSSSFSIRSRAVYLPFACCFSTAFSEAWWMALSRSSWSRASFSSLVSRARSRMAAGVYGAARRVEPRSGPVLAAPRAHAQRPRRARAVPVADEHHDGEPLGVAGGAQLAAGAQHALRELRGERPRASGERDPQVPVAERERRA